MANRSSIEIVEDSAKLLYTREESAEILGVSFHTVARDTRRGRIKCVRYGKRVLIPKSELLRIASVGMCATV